MNLNQARAKFKQLIAAEEISWTNHAKAQMRDRDVSIREVMRALEAGHEVEGPFLDISGDWKCTFCGNSAGTGVQVVAVLIEQDEETCLLITVMVKER